jgi:hypothetical protein
MNLKKELQQALLAEYLSGKVGREISQKFGISISTVYVVIQKFPEYAQERQKRMLLQCLICRKMFKRKDVRHSSAIVCSKECLILKSELVKKIKIDSRLRLTEKQCSKCKQLLPISEFYWDKNGNVWYSLCKKCHRVYCYAWNAANKERLKEINTRAMKRHLLKKKLTKLQK